MCGFFFGWWGADPSTQPPTWRTSASLFVWVLSFDLSGKGDPASSYATAGIALWIIAPRKPPYPVKDALVKVEILQGGISLLILFIISNLVSSYLNKRPTDEGIYKKNVVFFSVSYVKPDRELSKIWNLLHITSQYVE